MEIFKNEWTEILPNGQKSSKLIEESPKEKMKMPFVFTSCRFHFKVEICLISRILLGAFYRICTGSENPVANAHPVQMQGFP